MKAKNISFCVLVFTTGLFFSLNSCQKEPTSINPDNDQQFYVLNTVDGSIISDEVRTISISNVKPIASQRVLKKSTNGHVRTHSGLAYSFSAKENSGGVHGQTQTISGWPGVIESMHVNSNCITVIGNRAFYGGVITQIEVGPYQPFTVGWQVYFAVEDNGEGNNSESDRYGMAIFLLPPGLDVNQVLPVEFIELYGIETWCDVWPIEYEDGQIPFLDGLMPTNVQVK
jgi:hypothetical protein